MRENDLIQPYILKLIDGYQKVDYAGKTYSLSIRWFNEGRSGKLYAEQLGGADFISCNWYLIKGSFRIKPCEMPLMKVHAFLMNYQVIQEN